MFIEIFAGLTYFLTPIISYFVSNYFMLQRYFLKQHKTGWLTISCIVGSILMLLYLNYPFFFIKTIHDLPIERGTLASMLDGLVMLLGFPFYYILVKLNIHVENLGPGGLVFYYSAGSFTLFALLQLLIQCIFARKIFAKSSWQVLVPLVITNILSWFVSILVTALAHISLQFLL